jgi:hypothetical protein
VTARYCSARGVLFRTRSEEPQTPTAGVPPTPPSSHHPPETVYLQTSAPKPNGKAIVAVVVGVTLVVIVAGLWAVGAFNSSSSSGSGTPTVNIGSAFKPSFYAASICPSGGKIVTTGCTAGDLINTLQVGNTNATFASVLFEVKASDGAVFVNTGVADFAILDSAAGGVAAYSTFSAGAGLAMSRAWASYEGTATSTTPLNDLFILIDLGTNLTTGALNGLTFLAVGTGSYSGITAPLALLGSIPIGSAFSAGNPVSGLCSTGYTYAANGCTSGDFVYTLTVESSSISFASVLFEVKTATGAIYTAASVGGFSIMNISEIVAAQMTPASTTLAMTSAFGTYSSVAGACNGANCGPSTPLTSVYTIVIDMGTANPTGQGYTFVAVGTAGYSGTTSPLLLP